MSHSQKHFSINEMLKNTLFAAIALVASCESHNKPTLTATKIEGIQICKLIKYHFRESDFYPDSMSGIDINKGFDNVFDMSSWSYVVGLDKKSFSIVHRERIEGKIVTVFDDESCTVTK